MVYKSGTVVNSYELTNIIHACMRDAGWRLVSGNSAEGIDSIFYSQGEEGDKDIYVRVAANQSDIVAKGDIQFPYSDGYNGFVNFFAYQYCPDGAATNYACSELGRYGPLLYCMGGNSSVLDMYNLINADGTPPDGYTMRRFNLGDTGTSINYGSGSDDISDGHRYLYFNSSGSTGLSVADLSYDTLNQWTIDSNFFNNHARRTAVWSRRGPREPMLWSLIYSPGGWNTRNQLTGTIVSGYTVPPWGSLASHGWAVAGIRRNRKKYIYVARGLGTATWARYDLDEDVWLSLSPSIPGNVQYGSSGVYASREVTGYEYDRIYTVIGGDPGSNGFYSISIADDGSVNPDGAGWVTHRVAPFTIGWYNVASGNLIHMGGDKLFLARTETNDLYSWEFPDLPTSTGPTWTNITNAFQSVMGGSSLSGYYPFFHVRNHLSSRVGVDENELTSYWIFVNKDRVIVVTKNYASSYFSAYDMAYSGLFETEYDKSSTETSEDVSVGSDTIKVSDTSIFRVGEYYQIVKHGPGRLVKFFTGEARMMGNSDRIKVTEVMQSTSSIKVAQALIDDYPAGSKIGKDVQPVGVLINETAEFQAMTNINLIDRQISSDPAFQTYRLGQTAQAIVTQSERISGSPVYPVVLKSQGKAGLVDTEIRGKLIGVYRGGTPGNEGTININGKTYVSFYFSSLLSRLFIGPME